MEFPSSTPEGYQTQAIGLDRTPQKALWGQHAEISAMKENQNGSTHLPAKGMPIAAVSRPGASPSNVRRENPSQQEPSNEEGLFMAPKPPAKCVIMSASAPEMWTLKHGPPPKRPRFRPVECFKDPDPFDLPEPDVPMSGSDLPSKIASSCPAYVAFCSGGASAGEGSLGRFTVPKTHLAGTPTILENLDAMMLGSIDEGCHEATNGWESTDDEMQAAMASDMDEDDKQQEEEGNDDVFSFDFTPPDGE